MHTLKTRLDRLEAAGGDTRKPVYVFGTDRQDMETKIADTHALHPGRQLVAFRWREPGEASP